MVHLRNIAFPEEFPRDKQEIDVLIELDFYYSFVTKDIVRGGVPVNQLQFTQLWVGSSVDQQVVMTKNALRL